MPPAMNATHAEVIARHDLRREAPAATPWHGLVLGNGDMGAVVFGPEDALRFRLNKLDLWDSRWATDDTAVELYPLSRFKELAQRESAHLAEGERIALFDRLPWDDSQRPYPCLRTAADFVVSCTPLVGHTPLRQGLRLRDATYHAQWEMSFWGKIGIELEAFLCADRNVLALRLRAGERAREFLALALRREPGGGRNWDNLHHGEFGLRAWRDPREGALDPPELFAEGPLARLTQHVPADPWCDAFTWTIAACATGEVPFLMSPAGYPLLDLRGGHAPEELTCFVSIATSRDSEEPCTAAEELARRAAAEGWEALHQEHTEAWERNWAACRVELADPALERKWYRAMYQTACHVRPDGPAPGLFGVGLPYDAGPWRGDRHNNWPEYASAFWGCFVANRTDLVANYVRHIEAFLPEARRLARETFECAGAAFPHLYIDYTRRPYFDNLWGRSLYLTAITAQNFWWLYLYTQDRDFLREHAFPLLAEAAEFYTSLVAQNPPGVYDLWPTVPPEYRGFLKDLALSRNCLIDLALVRFLLRAVLRAVELLDLDDARAGGWRDLLEHLPPYPELELEGRTLFTDVTGNLEVPPYNHPIGVSPLFPGEDPDCFGTGRWRETAEATLRWRQWGDFEQIAYARLGDAETTWRLAGGGRAVSEGNDANLNYATPSKHLQAVAELLLQSWDGVLRVFPAWPRRLDARFEDLRAVGAFLVSAACVGGEVQPVRVVSEAGGPCRIAAPWPRTEVRSAGTDEPVAVEESAGVLSFLTAAGEAYLLAPEA